MKVPSRLETPRLLLRPHHMADLDAFSEFVLNPITTQYMSFTPDQKTRQGAEEMLRFVIGSYGTPDSILSLTIANPITDEYLGSCGASESGDDVEIYYTLLPEHTGKGFATEAAQALIQYLLETTEVTLVAHVIPENEPSVRVAERLGFEDEGPVTHEGHVGDLPSEALQCHRYVLRRGSP